MTFQYHALNLQKFYKMLRNNGFPKDHIKTFFANRGHLPADIEGVYSATEKAVIRSHVSYICRKQHCADTLVLYLNSPTCSDGTMLLWDTNLNGIVAGMSHLLKPWAGILNVTMADGEIRREYQGCQNLPTALWYQKYRNPN
uniref:Uncharacterized protein n=2 Tax=Nothobranchiidae TaxID=405002 RepID=A0A1A8JD71_NOTKU